MEFYQGPRHLDYPAAQVKPSRDGFVPGKELDEFIRQVILLTPQLFRDLRESKQKVQGELDGKTKDRILRAFADAWGELDADEYSLFRTRGGRAKGTAEAWCDDSETRKRFNDEIDSTLALDWASVVPGVVHLYRTSPVNCAHEQRTRAGDVL